MSDFLFKKDVDIYDPNVSGLVEFEAERQARAERAAKAKAAQAANPAPAAETTPADEQLKRLKIAASMAQVALKKAEKQLAIHDTAELQNQVSELRAAAQAAEQALQAAQTSAPSTPPAAAGRAGPCPSLVACGR